MGCSERQREIRRRRHRRKKVVQLQKKIKGATPSEQTVIAQKLRNLTPGADELIRRWDLEERV